MIQSAAHLGAKKALDIVSCVFKYLDPRGLGSVTELQFFTQVQADVNYWNFFRQILILSSLGDVFSVEYKDARSRFLEISTEIGALPRPLPSRNPEPVSEIEVSADTSTKLKNVFERLEEEVQDEVTSF